MSMILSLSACTAGTYFSNLLALENLKVLVIDKDKEEDLAKRLDIIHFTRDSYQEFDIEESKEGDVLVRNNTKVIHARLWDKVGTMADTISDYEGD